MNQISDQLCQKLKQTPSLKQNLLQRQLFFGNSKIPVQMRGNQHPVSAARWQQESQICFETFI